MANKLAIVTGATGGIGEVVASHLVTAGYHVVACGRNVEKLTSLGESSMFITPLWIDLAIAQKADITRSLDSALLPWYYRVDLLVCAHGAAPCKKSMLSLGETNDVIPILNTDVLGAFAMAQVVGACMVAAQGGSMVFISSAHAYQSYPDRVPYAMAKSSVVAMARALAVEWGKYGVRVNSISPWQVAGPRSDAVSSSEYIENGQHAIELYKKKSPLRRLVDPNDIAKTVVYLANNESMTGQDIRVDCGVSASMWHRGFEE